MWESTIVAGARMDVRRATVEPRAEAPAIVLLPGLGLSGHYVLPVGLELAKRYPVHVPDLPSHARRRAPRDALDLPGLADAVVRWMEVVGLERAVLVGNSMGCQVAVEAAARHPDRVTAIVLEGPTIDAAARNLWQQAWRMFLAGRREPPSLGPLQVVDWSTSLVRPLLATVRHTFAHRIEAVVGDVSCPALVLRGADDPIVPRQWAQRLAAGLPRGTFTEVPDAGHLLTYSRPRELAELVDGFLVGLEVAS